MARKSSALRARQRPVLPGEQEALAAFQRGDLLAAEQIARDILKHSPNDAFAHQLIGIVAHRGGRYDDAVRSLEASVALKPNEPETLCNLGAALRALGRTQDAEAAYERALILNPAYVPALNNLGNLLNAIGKTKDAVAAFRATVAAQRDHADAWNSLGLILQAQGELADAEAAFLDTVRAQPRHWDGWNNLGLCRMTLGKLDAAQDAFHRAIEIRPESDVSHGNLGALFLRASQMIAAERQSRKAMALRPDQPQWISNTATALQAQGRWEEAEGLFRKALALRPDYVTGHSNLLFCRNYRPDLTAEQVFDEYRRWDAAHGGVRTAAAFNNTRDPARRLRIGYLSPDFRQHAAAFFIEPLLAAHGRDAVEVYCYAEVANPDAVTARLRDLADHWRSTVGLTTEALAETIRTDGIDILIDLGGHTASSRLLVLTHRPAPVQIAHFLGHGYTSGLAAADAFIGDDALLPEGSERLFSERAFIRLNRIPLAYAPPEQMPDVTLLPALARGHVTFGYFGRTERLNDDVIAAWSKILQLVPKAQLVLNNGNFTEEEFAAQMRERFAKHGISADRLELCYTHPQPNTWAAYGNIDIALDPFPHNAGTTTIEALWLGVPVVSLADRPSVGRFGASILGCMGLSDWVASDVANYVDKAVATATDLPGLTQLRTTLRQRFQASPLVDAKGLTRELESAYRKLWTSWCESEAAGPLPMLSLLANGDAEGARRNAEATLQQSSSGEAHEVLGLIAYSQGDHARATSHLKAAIELAPQARTWSNYGAALRAKGDLAAAEHAYRQALAADPSLWDAYNNLANLLMSDARLDDAEVILHEATQKCPHLAVTSARLGDLLTGRRRHAEAAEAYRTALALAPNDPALRMKRAVALAEADDLTGAATEFEALLAITPDHVDGWTALSELCRRTGRIVDAEKAARKALALNPAAAAAANNLGNALVAQHRLAEAEEAFAKAIAIDPQRVEAYSNRALSLLKRGHAIAAEADLRKALVLRPDMAEMNINLASALEEQGRLPEAEAAFRAALAARPGMSRGHGSLLFCLNYRPELPAEEIFAEFRRWNELHAKPLLAKDRAYANDRSTTRRLRIGYISPDFKKKSAAFFTEPLLATHDHQQVEVYCYAEVAREDETTQRFKALADHWRPTVGLSDNQVAQMIRDDRIDILVDMGGHTADNRLLALARKPAPVQIAYLVGHGYTSGLSAMDVFLADKELVPPDADRFFSERVVRLDRIPLAYLPDENMPTPSPLPALARGHVTFGHFGRTVRINERVIDAWSEILRRVPNSRLVLNHTPFLEPATQELYAQRFAAHGIGRERLDLVYTSPQPRTWDAYAGIDIALDPFPHNAGTTTIEALWLGVPVLSLADRASVGRFGASILGSVGLSNWVADSVEAYVDKAVAATGDLDALATLRAGIRDRFKASPLYDANGLARAMEETYRSLWQAWCNDQTPASLDEAIAAFQRGDLDGAKQFCDRLVSEAATAPDALHLRGLIAYQRNAFALADTDIAEAIRRNPNVAEWHANHTAVLRRLGRLEDAVNAGLAAVALNPNTAEAHNNVANALKELNRAGDAEEHFRKAVALRPDYADAWSNLSGLLSTAGQAREAENCARQAIACDPTNANSQNFLGTALLLQERLPEATTAFAQALALKPDFTLAHSNYLFCANYRTDLSPEKIFAEYKRWDATHAKPLMPTNPACANTRDPKRRLRVGYFSPDFRYHAVSFFIEPLLAAHDRGEIELFLYSEVAAPDAVTERFRALADRWQPTIGLSDEAVAEMIRKDGVDIFVDLAGHTASNRLLVFARRPAPVQVTHIVGHGYTTGLSAIDAVLGDAAMMPEGSDHLFSERVMRLDRIPLVYAPPPGLPAPSPLPALANGHVTFGCFSRTARINDGVVAAWSQILTSVPGSRLVLNSKPFQEEATRAAFAARFAAHGIAAERLDLVYTTPQPRTWDAYGAIDIALDPFPHNAGTTTIEALWLGVPVVSLADRPSVGRFGATILGTLGMSDWVAQDMPDYVARAVAAATDLSALTAVRAGLRARFEVSPLRDAAGLARSVERAYRQLWAEYCRS